MKTRTRFPKKIQETTNFFITLADGTQLAARMWMPTDAHKKPVPAILEYLPYRKRDGTIVRDALTHPYLAGHGYACLRVDMRGNGDSDGVMLDEYVEQELADCEEVIAWIAAQPWCTGNVGMMGISWGGFNGLQVAARQPKALKAIITLCSTDDRYTDDIHYKGGCLLSENMGWSATMLAYSSRPADPALVGDAWYEQWLERLKAEPLLAIEWLKHPHRDAYWKHGSVNQDIGAIKAAVLAVGGWNDAYTNTVPRLVASLQSPTKGIIGPWAHKYPHFAVPEPRIGFLQEALRWWDQWLKGINTGVQNDPAFRTYIMDVQRPGASISHISGRWVADQQWRGPQIKTARYGLSNGQLAPLALDARLKASKSTRDWVDLQSPQTTGADSGEYCIIWLGPEFAGDQRTDDAHSLCFETSPLAKDHDLVGAPLLKLRFSTDQPVAQVAVRLNAVWPDGASTRLTYAVRNLCHPDTGPGHDHPQALVPGAINTIAIQLDDVAYRLPKGCRLRLAISTAYWPLIWPTPVAATVKVDTQGSSLELPMRSAVKKEIPVSFEPPESAPPVQQTVLQAPNNQRTLLINQATREQTLNIVDDFGRYRINEHGLEYAACARETYRIQPNDPLSAVQECHWTERRARGDWSVRTETYSKMTASKTHWHVTGRLEAYRGDALVFSKDWDEKVKRRLV
jgi:putative CocE/NonD family hydrolase